MGGKSSLVSLRSIIIAHLPDQRVDVKVALLPSQDGSGAPWHQGVKAARHLYGEGVSNFFDPGEDFESGRGGGDIHRDPLHSCSSSSDLSSSPSRPLGMSDDDRSEASA